MPNKSPEPTVVGAVSLSEKVRVIHRFSSTVAQLFSLGGIERMTTKSSIDWKRSVFWASMASLIAFVLSLAVFYFSITEDRPEFSRSNAWFLAVPIAVIVFVLALIIAPFLFKKYAA